MLWCTRHYPNCFGLKTWQYMKICSFSILHNSFGLVDYQINRMNNLRNSIRIFWKLVGHTLWKFKKFYSQHNVIHNVWNITQSEHSKYANIDIKKNIIKRWNTSNFFTFCCCLISRVKNYYFWFTKKSWKGFKKHKR